MTKKSNNSKPQKMTRSQRREFDDVLNELTRQSSSFQKASNNKTLFGACAAWISVCPLYLYGKGIYEASLKDNFIVFAIGVIIGGSVLYYLYSSLSAQKRAKLLRSGNYDFDSEEERTRAVTGVAQKSAYYSIFTINILYLAFFLLALLYILPTFQLSHPTNFSISSTFAAALSALMVSSRVL